MKKILIVLGFILLSSTTFAAGSLQIGIEEIHHKVLPSNAIRVPIAEFQFTANREPIEISGLEIIREGLSANNNFGSVWAETDYFQRSLRTRFQYDDTAKMKFRSPLLIYPGETRTILVFVNIEEMQYGRTAQFHLNGLWTDAEDIWVE